jgi:hypothetical protein
MRPQPAEQSTAAPEQSKERRAVAAPAGPWKQQAAHSYVQAVATVGRVKPKEATPSKWSAICDLCL